MSSGLLSFLSSLGKFWQEKTNQLFFRWNLLFIASQLLLLFWKFSDLPSAVPLYFSLPWGDSRLAPPLSLFLLPLFSILIVLTNHIFAFFLHSRHLLFSRLLIIFSLAFSLLNAFALLKIILLVV